MQRIRAALAAACLLAFGAACTTPATTSPAAAGADKPRLVVLLVIDGFPQRQLVDYRDQLGPDGFRRFLDRGAWFADAHYGHAFTVTAAGHATMLTGTYAHRHGIIGNDWRVRATGERMYCTGDADHQYIGHTAGKLDGTSPRNLRVESLGDVLKRTHPGAKVIGISAKDRGAILPAGKAGTAYMFMVETGQFASSTYYMKEHPEWVQRFNAAKPADAFFHQEWKPLLPDGAYARSLPDGQSWYRKAGMLPKKVGEGSGRPGRPYYADLIVSPFSDRLTLDFARAAIEGEALGQDDVPDILSVSLSGHDYVNHAYSAESRISHDHVLHLDRAIAGFFRDLDAKIGPGRYVVAFTSDHGFMPAPEHSQSLGRDAGRLSGSGTVKKVNAALARRFGQDNLVRAISARGLLFDDAVVARTGVAPARIHEEARKLLLAEPAIDAAYTRAELESGSRKGEKHFDAIRRSWNRELSGDVEYALKPYWMMASSSAATHGSPHGYDTHVPLAFYGPAHVAPGKREGRVEVADLAPTLAGVLGIPPPSSAEGRALPLSGGR